MQNAPNTVTVAITDKHVARIADIAEVDPRTVVRRLAKLPVRGRLCIRVDRAIAHVLGSPEPT